jgi:DNA mismatch repair protein MutL
MSKIRLLPDHVSNQIAAGEVVERPAATRIVIDVESGGRRLLKVADDGEGMVRDDAVLAFERHATSKISTSDDLSAIATLGFRGEALASIASVARVELITKTEEVAAATRVVIEGGRMRDVKDAAHPKGTTISVRDLFFNVPARRKFLRSEATESFHLTNLVTHYALAHPEIAFSLTNNGREILRASPAKDLRERAYQIFGAEFLDNLLEIRGGDSPIGRVSGYVSAPRDRRTSRDAQYLFVNGRYVRDRLIARALSEGYRSILPHGVYPAALLFMEIPLEEVDVNVHPAKTEVRFRRAAAVADAVREAVRAALASAGYVLSVAKEVAQAQMATSASEQESSTAVSAGAADGASISYSARDAAADDTNGRLGQSTIHFAPARSENDDLLVEAAQYAAAREIARENHLNRGELVVRETTLSRTDTLTSTPETARKSSTEPVTKSITLPPLASAEKFTREVTVESLSTNIRPLGQLEESFIVATDDEGLLLIDQHVAHERILFDKYRALEIERRAESQNLLIPETFDLTPAQAAAFDLVLEELEAYGFELMRLSGRTVAIRATPADLPASEARNMLAEILDTVDAEKKGMARETLRDEIAASLACHAAIKVNMPLAPEKMRWLIDRLLNTSSPTTCPHGRPVILRLAMRDILKGFHRI